MGKKKKDALDRIAEILEAIGDAEMVEAFSTLRDEPTATETELKTSLCALRARLEGALEITGDLYDELVTEGE